MMLASEIVQLLTDAIEVHGDLEFVVGYDNAQTETLNPGELLIGTEQLSDTWGPRSLGIVDRLDNNCNATGKRCFQI